MKYIKVILGKDIVWKFAIENVTKFEYTARNKMKRSSAQKMNKNVLTQLQSETLFIHNLRASLSRKVDVYEGVYFGLHIYYSCDICSLRD